LPLLQAVQINYIKLENYQQYLKLGTPVSCVRLYIYFKQKQSWLTNINYIVGEFLGHWLIKINNRTVMLAYTDGERADKMYKFGLSKSINIIVNEFKNYNIIINQSDIKKAWFAYWKEAISIVKSNVSLKLLQISRLKLPPNLFDAVIPLDNGVEECWMESHLLKLT
jgi:hypothetical protein